MMAVKKNKTLLIALIALAVFALAAFIIPSGTAGAAPLTVNNHKTRAHQDLQFYPGAPNNGRNGSFETPTITGNDEEIETSAAQPWKTRGGTGSAVETKMHLIKSVAPNITTSRGSQFASVNATTMGVLYQDLTLVKDQPYYVKFRYRGGTENAWDEMMFYFRQKGSTAAGFAVSGAAHSGWLDYTYLLTPSAPDYEVAFEVSGQANKTTWQGNYIDDVQVLTPSFLDTKLSVKEVDGEDASATPTRYRDRYVTYLLEVRNIGETDAHKAVAHLPIVDGLSWSGKPQVTIAGTDTTVSTSISDNTLSFNLGEGSGAAGTGGSLAAKSRTYGYEIRLRVTGQRTDKSYLTPGTLVKNQAKVTYDDSVGSITNVSGNKTAGPYTNYSKSDSLAEFVYEECGVSGYVFRDFKDDGYYVPADSDTILTSLPAYVRVYKAGTSELAKDEDNDPVQMRMINTTPAGHFTLYGLKPGRYDIYLDEVPGYMVARYGQTVTPNSNKALADGKRYVIKNVNITGTKNDGTAGPIFATDQNFGLKDNLTYKMVLKSYVSISEPFPQQSGSDPNKSATAGGDDLYTLDYGVPTRLDYTVDRNGAAIENVPVTVTLTTTPGSMPELVYPDTGKISRNPNGSWQVLWEMNGFTDTTKKFQVLYRPYEKPMDELEMGTSLFVSTMGRNNTYYMQISDRKYNTSIQKQLYDKSGNSSRTSDKDEEFTYKIDYRARAETDVLYTFYAKVTVPAGQDKGAVQLSNLYGGHYTVTELNSNWKFTIGDEHLVQTGSLGPVYEGFAGVTYAYRNNEQSNKWIDGNTTVRNKMAQP